MRPGDEVLRLTRPLLRVVLAVSLDGRLAPPGGGAAQLGGPGDRRALEEALCWADAALVGAETLRRHGSTCLIHHADLLDQRRRAGEPAQPIAIAVSAGGLLPPGLPFFRQSLSRWLLAPPTATAPWADRSAFDRLLPLNGWPAALAQLQALGLRRLLVLGGSGLIASLAEAAVLDELQLTICPRLLGGGHGWLPAAAVVPAWLQEGWQLLEHRPLGGEELLLRYGRPGGQRPSVQG
jgi:5-amino-6-(5-phosphoribosylamino)uracil reductase